jgi:hypothetical protein
LSLIIREEQRLRVFENRVLRGIFGPKGDEVKDAIKIINNSEYSLKAYHIRVTIYSNNHKTSNLCTQLKTAFVSPYLFRSYRAIFNGGLKISGSDVT